MTVTSAHDFFQGSASVAGALIGLLFVAISVASDRVIGPDASEAHTVRAAATLTAFTNALIVALFGLVPGHELGGATTSVAIVGLLFIAGSLLRVIPAWRAGRIQLRDVSYLVVLLIVFILQLSFGIGLDKHRESVGNLRGVCVIVIVCFIIGIARAWELIGGPRVSLTGELIRRYMPSDDAADEDGPKGS